MLRAPALKKVLQQVATGGVEKVLLLTTTGEVISSVSAESSTSSPSRNGAGNNENNNHLSSGSTDSLLVAVVTNLWRAYATNDCTTNKVTGEPEPESLETLIADVGERKFCALGVGSGAVICLVAHQDVEVGMLKLKAASLQAHLDEPLRKIYN